MLIAELAQRFRENSRHFSACPLYEHILNVVAGNVDVLEIVANMPKGPQPTNLLLASVHYLLLREPDEELAQWYESIVDNPRPVKTVDEPFVSFCLKNSEAITNLLQTRLVQTNEVARCIPLRVALAKLAKEIKQPCDYVEIGASAGLLMLFEDFRYEVGDQVFGSETSPLALSTTWEGEVLPIQPLPELRSIEGIDLHPIDLNDPDQRLWLQALVWPNAHHRRRQLERAFSVAKHSDKRVFSMDINEWIARQIEQEPKDTPLVIFHAAVRAHVPREVWEAFAKGLDRLAQRRPVHVISMESDIRNRSGLTGRSPFILEIQHVPGPSQALAALDGHVSWIAPVAI